ncbi:5551_t:CDS:2 [Funneliformis geosporum]|uniref:5551_t:CDS:1 n=1 Tax=Funneliformis geosporum TaxID=1117311 RepID=A0A9W4SA75_9GLOM|nr:5551_t:CDS:2 [Funneliformis geosporum]
MTKNQKKPFKEYLQEIEDLKNNSEINYALPENPTPLQVAKFEICQEVLGYKQDNKLTREQVAEKMDISKAETEDILFCHIEEFTLDRLVAYASKLLDPIQVKVILEPKKSPLHAKSKIIAITITDHYQQKLGREWITNELVLEILEKLNGWRLEPTKYHGKRKTEPLTIYELGIAILYKLMTIIAFFSQKGEVVMNEAKLRTKFLTKIIDAPVRTSQATLVPNSLILIIRRTGASRANLIPAVEGFNASAKAKIDKKTPFCP